MIPSKIHMETALGQRPTSKNVKPHKPSPSSRLIDWLVYSYIGKMELLSFGAIGFPTLYMLYYVRKKYFVHI